MILQSSNEHLQNVRTLRQELEDTAVLEGPFPVPRWVPPGQQRMLSFTRSGYHYSLIKGVKNHIEYTKVTEEMEALLLLERYCPGAGEVIWSIAEPERGPESRTWVFPGPPILER